MDRSRGRPFLPAPSSTELMEKVPAWPDFIRSITRWGRVEPGTLTLVNVEPLPGPALGSVDVLTLMSLVWSLTIFSMSTMPNTQLSYVSAVASVVFMVPSRAQAVAATLRP